MKGIIIFVLICMIAPACEDVVNRPIDNPAAPVLVVEGVISNQLMNHRIKLSWTSPQQNGVVTPATGAVVMIHGGGVSRTLIETSMSSGEYATTPTRFESGTMFTLEIRHQDKTYLAQDSSVPVELLPSFEYTKAGDRYRLVLQNSGVSAHYVSHDIDWSDTAACAAGELCRGVVNYYDLKTIDVNEITKPPKEDFTFPAGSRVIRTRYSVSTSYRTFLRSVLSETEWRGSAFDVDRGNAPTNLTGGAVGFFAVTSVVGDTTIVVEKP